MARKRRGFTKAKLAEKIGVTPTVSGYEAGEYPPSDDILRKISIALDFPIACLCGGELEEPLPDVTSFRAMTKMSAARRDMALSQGAIALRLSDWLATQFELPEAQLPDLGREHPEAAAESLRRVFGLGELPIRNMIHLLEASGVRVFSLAINTREVDAFSLWRGSTPFVFLNTNKSSEHSRFDAAHELGHLILHRHGAPHGREAENEANAFARAFLLPRASVIAHAPIFSTYPVLTKLKKIWNVSVSALNYRLHQLGLTSDWHYRGICIEIAKRGRDAEPETAPRETSLILPRVFAALGEEGLTRSKIAQRLAVPQRELAQLLFGLVIAGIEGGGRRSATGPSQSKLTRIEIE